MSAGLVFIIFIECVCRSLFYWICTPVFISFRMCVRHLQMSVGLVVIQHVFSFHVCKGQFSAFLSNVQIERHRPLSHLNIWYVDLIFFHIPVDLFEYVYRTSFFSLSHFFLIGLFSETASFLYVGFFRVTVSTENATPPTPPNPETLISRYTFKLPLWGGYDE